jgi:hypothetical protein
MKKLNFYCFLLFAFAVLALTALGTRAADMTAAEAFEAGKSFGAANKDNVRSQLNTTSGTNVIPGFGQSASDQTKHFQDGQGSTASGAGTQKIDNCAADANPSPECDAINLLATAPSRPKYPISRTELPPTPPPTSIDGNYTDCKPQTTVSPPTTSIEICTESKTLEETKCQRKYTAKVTTSDTTQRLVFDKGNEMKPVEARTFRIEIDLPIAPSLSLITYYKVLNMGQLWINGSLVFENPAPGYSSDMRDGEVRNVCTPSGGDGETFWNCDSFFFGKTQSMSSIEIYNRYGFNPGAYGLSPNKDITSAFKSGKNLIEFACVNVTHYPACKIELLNTTTNRRVDVVTDNQCATLEAKAK